MKFEYNGNLEEPKRVLLVANEIKLKYPEIDMKDAKIIASLEAPITTMKTSEMEFNRLYNILFIMQKDKYIFEYIYEDIKKVYRNLMNKKDELLDRMMLELFKFISGQRYDFPIISEFV